MSTELLGVLMLGLLVAAIMLGFPTAFTLMALGVIFGFLGMGDLVFNLLVQRAFAVMTNDVLISVPLFIFMGYIVERAGILDRLFRSIQLAMGPVRGSLAIATLITCTIFATATGIIGAAVTLMALLALPAMLRAKYDVKLSTGTIAAGGTLGILIPPSVLLILYGATAGVSVPRLYAAAFLPGLLLSALYLLYIVARVNLNPALAPTLPKEERNVPASRIAVMLLTSFVPITALILTVLGSILFGLATPSEAAGVGAVLCLLLVVLVYRVWRPRELWPILEATIRESTMILMIIATSILFGYMLSSLYVTQSIAQSIAALEVNRWVLLFWINLLLLVAGCFLPPAAIILMTTPIVLPILVAAGFDPVWFGVILTLNMELGLITPPVGLNLFVINGIAPDVPLGTVLKGALPFMLLMVVAIVILCLFPGLATWLPDQLMGPRVG